MSFSDWNYLKERLLSVNIKSRGLVKHRSCYARLWVWRAGLMTCDDSARMVIPHLNGPSPITTRSVSPAQVSPVITITNKVQNRQAVVVDICSSNFYEACNLEPSSILFGRWCSQLRSDSVVTAVYVYYNQEFLPRKQIIQFLKNVASRTHVNYSPM